MLPEERRNPETASNILATFVNHPDADQGVPPVQRPPAVRLDAAAAAARAGHPAGRAPHRLRVRVGASTSRWACDEGLTDDDDRRRPARRGGRRVRPHGAGRGRRTPRELRRCRTRRGPRWASASTSDSGWTSSSRSAATSHVAMALNTFGVETRTGEVDNVAFFPKPAAAAGPRTGPNSAPRRSNYERLDRPGALEARAAGDLQEDLAQRRPGGAAPQEGQLLHPRDAVGGPGHVGDHRQGQRRTRSARSTTCAATAETSWCGTTIPARRSPAPAASSPASTTRGATASRAT